MHKLQVVMDCLFKISILVFKAVLAIGSIFAFIILAILTSANR